jgi:mono/diheme cytochrome c family protein
VAIVLAALGVLAAGCGKSGTAVGPLPTTVVGTVAAAPVATVPAKYKNGDATAGKAVFTSAGCVGCHTLSAAGSTGTVGPNLDDAKPSLSLVIERVTHGAGAMPNFSTQLSAKQIADVAAFVVSSTGGSTSG